MDSKKILVVDDEKNIRIIYQAELEAMGYCVVTSDGSENILDLISEKNPNLIILDIKLAVDRSGLDLLQDIRNSNSQIPVILCTAYDAFKNDVKSIAATDYVVKSGDLSELKTKIGNLI